MQADTYWSVLEQDYRELQKDYSLPSFEELKNEVDLSGIRVKEVDLLLIIMRRVYNEYNNLAGFILRMFEPPRSLHASIELSGFSAEKKDAFFERFKPFGKTIRKGQAVLFSNDKKQMALFIQTHLADLQGLRSMAISAAQELEQGWDHEEKSEKMHYLG